MGAALGQQWVSVTFKPDTGIATINKIRAACSHVPNVHADPLAGKHTVLNLIAGMRFDTTNATVANVAQLEQCVQRFPSVVGFTPQDSGDTG